MHFSELGGFVPKSFDMSDYKSLLRAKKSVLARLYAERHYTIKQLVDMHVQTAIHPSNDYFIGWMYPEERKAVLSIFEVKNSKMLSIFNEHGRQITTHYISENRYSELLNKQNIFINQNKSMISEIRNEYLELVSYQAMIET